MHCENLPLEKGQKGNKLWKMKDFVILTKKSYGKKLSTGSLKAPTFDFLKVLDVRNWTGKGIFIWNYLEKKLIFKIFMLSKDEDGDCHIFDVLRMQKC